VRLANQRGVGLIDDFMLLQQSGLFE